MKKLSNLKLPQEKLFDTDESFTMVTAPLFELDGNIYCNSECEYAYLFSDYYGEFRGECSWINPKLEEWAVENFGEDAYWEWENPGCLCLCV
jgi:hypothetical protein